MQANLKSLLSVFSLGRSSKALIGLDISSSSIKMVELSRDPRRGYRVEHYVTEILPRDAVSDGNIANIEAVSETIRRAWKRLGSSTKRVALALPSAHVITKKIIVPAGQRDDELEMVVESEANQYIPFPLEEVNLDFQIIGDSPSSPEDKEVLIAASRKEKVEDREAVVEAAGLEAAIMDIESYAVLSAFELIEAQLPDRGRDAIIALADIGAHIMSLTVLKNHQQLYMREQAFGGNKLTQDIARHAKVSFEEAEADKRRGNLPEAYGAEFIQPFVDNMALEVSRALQFFFTSTQYSKINYIVLSGGCAILPNAAQAIEARTQVKTIVANPFANMQLSDKLSSDRRFMTDTPSLIVACGLALRRFDE